MEADLIIKVRCV